MNNITVGKISFNNAQGKLSVDFSDLEETLKKLITFGPSDDPMKKLIIAVKKLIKRIDIVNEVDQDVLILRNKVMSAVEDIETKKKLWKN